MYVQKHSTLLFICIFSLSFYAFLGCSQAAAKGTILHTFTGGNDGGNSSGKLILDADGNLYGTAQKGGTANAGIVFQLKPSSHGWHENVLYSFAGSGDGAQPSAGLVFDRAGNLYGTTTLGGASGTGTVFELSPSSNGAWTKTTLYNFTNGPDGGYPQTGSLLFDQKGNLYGTTQTGGTGFDGTVFQLSPNHGAWKETVIYNFNTNSGYYPGYDLAFDAKGNLYGTTGGGGQNLGIVYELSPNSNGSWTYTILYTFQGGDEGGYLLAGVILDAQGNLYGEALQGSPSGNGLVFELTPNSDGTWSETVLWAFDLGDGSSPSGGLTFDSHGNLFGTTSSGGSGGCTYPGCGTVFELTPSNGVWTETLYSFHGLTDGSYPISAVTVDANETVYGTTFLGGAHDAGNVFAGKP